MLDTLAAAQKRDWNVAKSKATVIGRLSLLLRGNVLCGFQPPGLRAWMGCQGKMSSNAAQVFACLLDDTGSSCTCLWDFQPLQIYWVRKKKKRKKWNCSLQNYVPRSAVQGASWTFSVAHFSLGPKTAFVFTLYANAKWMLSHESLGLLF